MAVERDKSNNWNADCLTPTPTGAIKEKLREGVYFPPSRAVFVGRETGRCPREDETMNERKRQELREERFALRAGRRTLRNWRFLCSDNVDFEAVAPSESGAFRVLNAERPGVTAQTMGFTEVRFR